MILKGWFRLIYSVFGVTEEKFHAVLASTAIGRLVLREGACPSGHLLISSVHPAQ